MRRARIEPWLIAGAFAGAYLILRPASADLAAQVYRTELFQREGFTVWNGNWYGGHHTMGYSVLFPPLAAVLGPRVVGALAAVASAILFERLAHRRFGTGARVGALWFGAATATNLFSGRLTFALGVAVGLGALLALQRGRTWLAVTLAAACPLGSPIAGLFLALVGLAFAAGDRRRAGLLVAGAAFTMSVALAVAFPEAGVEPFVTSAFWPVLAFTAAVLAFVPAEERALRLGAVLYAGACLAAFALATPMGGNATRLGTMFGGPLLACALWRRRPLVLAALAVPLLYWQWAPPFRDVAVASGDPSVKASYYAPLNGFLASAPRGFGRVEIPLTRNHWETVYVARRFPLARGWERQLDVKYNRLFYRPRLTAGAYLAWLRANGVRYVALPDARLDYAATNEARLIRGGLPYLTRVWSGPHWQVFRVRRPSPFVLGPARLESLGPQSFRLRAASPGWVTVRVRYTPYWEIAAGSGCIERTATDLTRLSVRRPGEVRVVARFDPGGLLDQDHRCPAPG